MPTRFLCDQMLLRLGRWLRAAGYDTSFAERGMKDSLLLAHAIQENRFLLTRDKHFLELKAPEGTVIHLKSNLLQDCIAELNLKLNVNWLYQPFSRCLICNAVLIKTEDVTLLKQLPLKVHTLTDQFWHCTHCQKLYWEGSHTENMKRQLQEWQTTNTNEK